MSAPPLDRRALGLGLRPRFYQDLERSSPRVDFFEALVENYLGAASLPRENLRRVAGRYPVVGHGVSLNLLGSDPLDMDYLSRVKDLIAEFHMPHMTDHLCWSAHGALTHHDLLPAPYARELVPYVAERAARVQEFLGVPFGIENLSSYVAFSRDDMTEWEFYRAVIEQSGCWHMLDVNNIFVSSKNHRFSASEYLAAVRWDRVLQVHIAGHQTRPDGILHDTHDRPVRAEVWQLYAEAWRLGGPFPTLLEWDADIPALEGAVEELLTAREFQTMAANTLPNSASPSEAAKGEQAP
jgi:uncharacterized protein